jgi:hypothetical protein
VFIMIYDQIAAYLNQTIDHDGSPAIALIACRQAYTRCWSPTASIGMAASRSAPPRTCCSPDGHPHGAAVHRA